MIELKVEGLEQVQAMVNAISSNANKDLQTVLDAEGREIVRKIRQNINLPGQIGSLLKSDIGSNRPRGYRKNPSLIIGPKFRKRKISGKNSMPIAPIAQHMIEGFNQTNRNRTGNRRNHGRVGARYSNPSLIVARTEQQSLMEAINKGLEKLIKKYGS